MTVNKALKILAKKIFGKGSKKNFECCLVPTVYEISGELSLFNAASDALNAKYGATHYSLEWVTEGKKVKVILGQADSFGAAIEVKPIEGAIFDVEI